MKKIYCDVCKEEVLGHYPQDEEVTIEGLTGKRDLGSMGTVNNKIRFHSCEKCRGELLSLIKEKLGK